MTSLFWYETFYYLWVKRFFDIRREIHNLSMMTFLSALLPTPTCVAPATRPLAWLRQASESQPSSPEAELNWFFFKSPKILRTRFRCMTTFTSQSPIWDFYFDISELHILPMRAWTPALLLHLTNPCAEPKGSQAN